MIEKLEKQLDRPAAGSAPAAARPAAAAGIPVLSKMEVEIYGGLIPFAESVRASGATTSAPADRPTQLAPATYTGTTQGSRGRVTVGTSHIGFRGSLAVAENYRALWQIEAGAALDGDSGGIGGTNVFGLRNSHVGLASPFGTLFVGNWDTPYKWASIPTVPLRGAATFDYNSLIGNPGFGVFGTTTQSGRANGKADAAFDRRQGNSLQYWTPSWNGLSGRLAYSLDEGKSSSATTPEIDPRLWSMSAGYTSGPLTLQYAYEEHRDYFGLTQLGGGTLSAANGSSKDVGHKLVAMYAFGRTRLTAIAEQLRYRNDDATPANVEEYKRNAYVVGVQQQFGPGKAWLSYGRASNGSCKLVGGGDCRTDELGAEMMTVGYVHSLNRLVDVYAAVYQLENGTSGTYQPVNSVNVPPNTTPAPGLTIRGVGVGAVMLF